MPHKKIEYTRNEQNHRVEVVPSFNNVISINMRTGIRKYFGHGTPNSGND